MFGNKVLNRRIITLRKQKDNRKCFPVVVKEQYILCKNT